MTIFITFVIYLPSWYYNIIYSLARGGNPEIPLEIWEVRDGTYLILGHPYLDANQVKQCTFTHLPCQRPPHTATTPMPTLNKHLN